MNYLEFILFLLEATDSEERRWGQEILESQKFDFGPYKVLPKLDKAEKVFPYVDHCPQAFNLPFDNCLFYTSDNVVFLHAKKSKEDGEETIIETKLCIYNEDNDKFYFSPIIGSIDFIGNRLAAEPFLDAEKKEKKKTLEELSFHYCLLASFLAIINSDNVEHIDNISSLKMPVIEGKIADKKLFIYKTLHIKPLTLSAKSQREISESESSTPSKVGVRVHLRRGHLRRLPGKIVWVQPAVVGSLKRGIVQKNYRVE